MHDDDEDDTPRTLNEPFEDAIVGAPIPLAPDGGIIPGYMAGESEAAPAMLPENCICLRGPCRHFWQMKTPVDSAAGFGVYSQLSYTCLRGPRETDLADTVVIDCNLWDPLTTRELKDLEGRRKKYE